MCDGCKKYALDHSTISADFIYCLHEVSSEKICLKNRFQRDSRQRQVLLAAPPFFPSSYTLHRAPVPLYVKKKRSSTSQKILPPPLFPSTYSPPLFWLKNKRILQSALVLVRVELSCLASGHVSRPRQSLYSP